MSFCCYHKYRSRNCKCLLVNVCSAKQNKDIDRVELLKFEQRRRNQFKLVQGAGKMQDILDEEK